MDICLFEETHLELDVCDLIRGYATGARAVGGDQLAGGLVRLSLLVVGASAERSAEELALATDLDILR